MYVQAQAVIHIPGCMRGMVYFHIVVLVRPRGPVDLCDPVVAPPIFKLVGIVLQVKDFHVSAMNKVVGQNGSVALATQGAHDPNVGRLISFQPSNERFDPSGCLELRVVIGAEKVLGSLIICLPCRKQVRKKA